MSLYFKACSFSLVAILLFLALFGTVGNGLRLDGVRALNGSINQHSSDAAYILGGHESFYGKPHSATREATRNSNADSLGPHSLIQLNFYRVLETSVSHIVERGRARDLESVCHGLRLYQRTRTISRLTEAPQIQFASARARRQGLTSENSEKSANNIKIVKSGKA